MISLFGRLSNAWWWDKDNKNLGCVDNYMFVHGVLDEKRIADAQHDYCIQLVIFMFFVLWNLIVFISKCSFYPILVFHRLGDGVVDI